MLQLTEVVKQIEAEIQTTQCQESATATILSIPAFDDIDVKQHQTIITDLEKERQRLEESNDLVKELKSRLTEVEQQEETLTSEYDQSQQEQGRLKLEIQNVQHMLESARLNLDDLKSRGIYESHAGSFASIETELGKRPLTINDFDERMLVWKRELQQNIRKLKEPIERLVDRLIEAMSRYLREFTEEADDLVARPEALESFLGRLEQIQEDDLPRYESRFKSRLNDQISKEIGVFNTLLLQEQQQIKSRINQLNKALKSVDYSSGTFMQLNAQPLKDKEIAQFRKLISECMDGSLEHTEAAYEQRYARIVKLVKQLSDKEKKTWKSKVLDVRNWYNFTAEEIVRETGAIRSSYSGSSGQSGGEKAKLAFTILVAALAYQFDIDPAKMSPGRFHFVVIDEMFSKVDDQNAEYALRLFQQFGLQLLIVAPLDAKAASHGAFRR
ncbi:MAG: SbcC/MukB-like Walker B domain-containing protein [Planctomycetaceae bacterium]